MHHYPAKLLLFGEHILLLGAPALSVPAPAFNGFWEQASSKADIRGLQMRLSEFAASAQLKAVPGLNTEQLKKDLLFGLYFRSNIPVGYGLGSSGALCAAIYDRYCREKTKDPAALKSIFAAMESFFHGASSGIDPLTSYLNKPLLIRNKSEVSIVEPAACDNPPLVFLLDSGLPRQTGPLVQWFMEQSGDAAFSRKLEEELLPANEAAIEAWMDGKTNEFWPDLQRISQFQFEHFQPMIPGSLRVVWEKSIDDQDFTLKLCGAGGGGFALGFARKRESLEHLEEEFRVVFPFDSINRDL